MAADLSEVSDTGLRRTESALRISAGRIAAQLCEVRAALKMVVGEQERRNGLVELDDEGL